MQKKKIQFICFLIILLTSLLIKTSLKANKQSLILNQQIAKIIPKKEHLRNDIVIKLNNYNVHIDNVEDFLRNKYFILIPGKNCGKREIKTFFFKPEHSYKFIKFKKKDISLKLILSKQETPPTVYVGNMTNIRKKFLMQAGFTLNSKMGLNNLYMTPYYINSKFKEGINNFILNKFQKINRFFDYEEYVSKSLIYNNYKRFKDRYPDDYKYLLETYSYPEQKDIIETKFKNYIINKSNCLWMIKPKLGSIGNNISILKDFSHKKIKLNEYIITKYLDNPHLIKGYKYDIRFYGLVSSIKPLKLYLYNEGYVRLCSEKYNFSYKSIDKKYGFITNLSLNKKNKEKYIYPKNIRNLEKSHLWDLETLQKYYKRNNINYNKIFFDVGDIFIKALLTVREKLIQTITENKLEFSNFYHLIGFDIILDDNLKPYLLEFNRRCDFRDDNFAEKYYVYNLIVDTLNIIGLRPINIQNENKNKKDKLIDILEDNLCELDRPRGGYELIFPKKDNFRKYKKFFGDRIPEEDQKLWKNLIE